MVRNERKISGCSELSLSRTVERTNHDRDSEYSRKISERNEDETIFGKMETVDTSPTIDMSEASVAEKAHYFEEQIQKEIIAAGLLPKNQLSLETKREISTISDDEVSLRVFEEIERFIEDRVKIEEKTVESKVDIKTWAERKEDMKDGTEEKENVVDEKKDEVKNDKHNVEVKIENDELEKKSVEEKRKSKTEGKKEEEKLLNPRFGLKKQKCSDQVKFLKKGNDKGRVDKNGADDNKKSPLDKRLQKSENRTSKENNIGMKKSRIVQELEHRKNVNTKIEEKKVIPTEVEKRLEITKGIKIEVKGKQEKKKTIKVLRQTEISENIRTRNKIDGLTKETKISKLKGVVSVNNMSLSKSKIPSAHVMNINKENRQKSIKIQENDKKQRTNTKYLSPITTKKSAKVKEETPLKQAKSLIKFKKESPTKPISLPQKYKKEYSPKSLSEKDKLSNSLPKEDNLISYSPIVLSPKFDKSRKAIPFKVSTKTKEASIETAELEDLKTFPLTTEHKDTAESTIDSQIKKELHTKSPLESENSINREDITGKISKSLVLVHEAIKEEFSMKSPILEDKLKDIFKEEEFHDEISKSVNNQRQKLLRSDDESENKTKPLIEIKESSPETISQDIHLNREKSIDEIFFRTRSPILITAESVYGKLPESHNPVNDKSEVRVPEKFLTPTKRRKFSQKLPKSIIRLRQKSRNRMISTLDNKLMVPTTNSDKSMYEISLSNQEIFTKSPPLNDNTRDILSIPQIEKTISARQKSMLILLQNESTENVIVELSLPVPLEKKSRHEISKSMIPVRENTKGEVKKKFSPT